MNWYLWSHSTIARYGSGTLKALKVPGDAQQSLNELICPRQYLMKNERLRNPMIMPIIIQEQSMLQSLEDSDFCLFSDNEVS